MLAILGMVMVFVGGIWLLVEAFKESLLWGFGCLIISPIALVFIVMHWSVSKIPFFIQIAGFALMFIGAEASQS